MGDGVDFKLTGLDSLLGKLENIEYDLKRKSGRAALRKAGNVIVAQIKANASRLDDPHTARKISENAALRWNGRLFKRTGNLGFRIGILQGAILTKKPDKGQDAPTPHWRLLEFGTEKMPAKPLVRAAASAKAQDAINTFVDEYGRSIERAIARAKKKGGNV